MTTNTTKQQARWVTRRIYGIGINDANYVVKPIVNGKREYCPYYTRWADMIKRCYSDKFLRDVPSYIGCTVSSEWLTFSNFRAWMVKQDWEGNHLDKDIIVKGNKVYSADTCCFVTQEVNKLILDGHSRRGPNPQGVNLDKRDNTYQASIRTYGKQKTIGCFSTAKEASKAYIKAKHAHIMAIAVEISDNRIRNGLIIHAKALQTGL
jgi:hypothetical protein